MLDNLMYSDFEEIPEQCNEGCGFIPKEILTRLLGSHVRGKQTMAIQVRLFAPKLGIFKGMLVEKYGITKIQLPPSMMKVGPSQSCTVLETIVLLVKSIFPSKTTAQVSHVLNLNWAEPSLKSFQPDQTLKLSTMITDLWQSQGVPSALIQSYKKSLTHMKEVHHSFLVGVADPTGSIPEGYIFVPGMGVKQCVLENLFVTRCPCMVQEDGRLLPVLNSKPMKMNQADWNFLNSFSFGVIIFGNSCPGFQALPSVVADGDLDGDLYFVCWHEAIVKSVMPLPICLSMSMSTNEKHTNTIRHADWLAQAQDLAANLGTLSEINFLVGKLYSLSKKFAALSQDGANDASAMAFGKAYQASLNLMKHSGKIKLQMPLWDNMPSQYHKYLVD